jgi:hypothetical protein
VNLFLETSYLGILDSSEMSNIDPILEVLGISELGTIDRFSFRQET